MRAAVLAGVSAVALQHAPRSDHGAALRHAPKTAGVGAPQVPGPAVPAPFGKDIAGYVYVPLGAPKPANVLFTAPTYMILGNGFIQDAKAVVPPGATVLGYYYALPPAIPSTTVPPGYVFAAAGLKSVPVGPNAMRCPNGAVVPSSQSCAPPEFAVLQNGYVQSLSAPIPNGSSVTYYYYPPPGPGQGVVPVTGGDRYSIAIASTTPLTTTPTVDSVQSLLPSNYSVIFVTIDPSMMGVGLVVDVAQTTDEPMFTFSSAVGAPIASNVTGTDNGPTPAPAPPGPVPGTDLTLTRGDRETVTVISPTPIATPPTVQSVQGSIPSVYGVVSVSLDVTQTVSTIVLDVYPSPSGISVQGVNNSTLTEPQDTFISAVGGNAGSTATVADNGPSPTVSLAAGHQYGITIGENTPPSAIPTTIFVQSQLPKIYQVVSTGPGSDGSSVYLVIISSGDVNENPLLFAVAVQAPPGSTVTVADLGLIATPTPAPVGGPSVTFTGGHMYVATITEPTPPTSVPAVTSVQALLPGTLGAPYTVLGVATPPGQPNVLTVSVYVAYTVTEAVAVFSNAVGAPAGSDVAIVDWGLTAAPPAPPALPPPAPGVPPAPPAPPTTPVKAAPPAAASSTGTAVAVVAGVAVVSALAWWAYDASKHGSSRRSQRRSR